MFVDIDIYIYVVYPHTKLNHFAECSIDLFIFSPLIIINTIFVCVYSIYRSTEMSIACPLLPKHTTKTHGFMRISREKCTMARFYLQANQKILKHIPCLPPFLWIFHCLIFFLPRLITFSSPVQRRSRFVITHDHIHIPHPYSHGCFSAAHSHTNIL